MNEDVKDKVKEVIFEQVEERSDEEMSTKERIQSDANLVKLVAALNEMEKIEQDRISRTNEHNLEERKFEHDKSIDNQKLTIESRKIEAEDDRFGNEMDMRKYESDAADRRAKMERDTDLEKIESEKKSNIFKTIIYGLGILAGVALHLGDVSAEKELGYDVDDRVSSFDKLKNDLKFFSK